MADETTLEELEREETEPDADADDAEQQSADPLEGREDLQQHLLKLYRKCCDEDRFARLVEVRNVWRAENYWRGQQRIWWSQRDQRFYVGQQGTVQDLDDVDVDDMPRFQFTENIYQADGLGCIGVVSQAPPRTRFFPEDPESPEDIETAEGYSKLIRIIERWNPTQLRMQEEVYHFWTGGTFGLHTEYVKDGERFGYGKSPQMELGEDREPDTLKCSCGYEVPAEKASFPVPCPMCGKTLTEDNVQPGRKTKIPQDAGETSNPKGRQVFNVYGALNMRRPIRANNQTQFHYFALEEEIHYAVLRREFPDQAEKIKPGAGSSGEDAFERNARLSVAEGTHLLVQTGDAQSVMTTRSRIWFRPAAWKMVEGDDAKKSGDGAKTPREELEELFPNGCHVVFCGDAYCGSREECMDDHWVIAHALRGKGQHRPGIGTSMLSPQDQLNVMVDVEMETFEYGIPITLFDVKVFDQEANADQRAEPGATLYIERAPNEPVSDSVGQVRADEPSQGMQKAMADIRGPVSQRLTGMYPALMGNPETGTDTMGGIAIQRDQAMGRMGVFYVVLKQAHADGATLACRDFCKCAKEDGVAKVSMPVLGKTGDYEAETVDVTALEGDARAYPEGDEAFPELWNQQRATVMQILDTPQGQAYLQEPDNAQLFVKLIGVQGIVIPGADAWAKQMKEIGELTDIPEGAEISPPVTIEPDSDEDQEAESKTCKRWMNSADGMRAKKKNPQGWQNVKAHKGMHDAIIQKLAAAAQPALPPPKESLTANFKDMPPEAQRQILAQMGIDLTPEDFMAKVLMDRASKGSKPNLPATGQAGQPANPPGGLGA